MPSQNSYFNRQRQTSGIVSDWLLKLLQDNHIPLSEAAIELGVSESEFNAPYNVLPFTLYNSLFEWAAQRLDNENIGISVAQNLSMKDLGVLGYLLMNCTTVEELCRVVDKYLPIFQRGAKVSFTQEADTCQVTYHLLNTSVPCMRQDTEFTLTIFIILLRQALGDSWTPENVFFAHSPPQDASVSNAIFGPKIHYDYAYSALTFSSHLLPFTLGDSDPELLNVLLKQADLSLEQVGDTGDIVRHVRLLITAALGYEDLNSDEIARELHMTRRTLHRHLREHGTTFQELRNQVVTQAAKEALAETQASITDIALKLGYSEISAFIRAFKRLTGSSPLQYRKDAQRNTLS